MGTVGNTESLQSLAFLRNGKKGSVAEAQGAGWILKIYGIFIFTRSNLTLFSFEVKASL